MRKDKSEAVYMIYEWNDKNISFGGAEELVTIMNCNELFGPKGIGNCKIKN